jgi:flagella basal body P-ring formation protein FlgA
MTMIRFALAALVSLTLAPFAAAQASGSQTTVRGDWIALGDVAPVTGEAAAILVGPAPPPGQTLALDPAFLVSVAKKSGVILAIPLDKPIWVTRAAGNATPAKAANVARPANTAPLLGGEAQEAEILILVRDVARGQRISDADIDWAPASSIRAARNSVSDMDLALGMEAKRALKTGQPLQPSDIRRPALIRKGEPVKLVYSSPGLKLTVDGQAQADAGKGENVRVLNTFSKRTIDAVAAAEGEAHVARR